MKVCLRSCLFLCIVWVTAPAPGNHPDSLALASGGENPRSHRRPSRAYIHVVHTYVMKGNRCRVGAWDRRVAAKNQRPPRGPSSPEKERSSPPLAQRSTPPPPPRQAGRRLRVSHPPGRQFPVKPPPPPPPPSNNPARGFTSCTSCGRRARRAPTGRGARA